MTTNHRTVAAQRLSACEAAVTTLKDVYSEPPTHHPIEAAARKHQVAALYDDIRQGAALAKVHALLHIGDQLERVASLLDDGRLSAAEVDALIAQGNHVG